MLRGIAVLAVAAALSGCTGGSTEELKTRARLHLSGEEGYLGCPALTVRRLERQGVAFSGTVARSSSPCLTRRWSADIAEQYEQAFPG